MQKAGERRQRMERRNRNSIRAKGRKKKLLWPIFIVLVSILEYAAANSLPEPQQSVIVYLYNKMNNNEMRMHAGVVVSVGTERTGR